MFTLNNGEVTQAMIVCKIFNKLQTIVHYSISELIAIYSAGKMDLREVSQQRVRDIKNYLIENTLGENIFFPPLVASVKEGKLSEGKPKCFTMIDGSTRMKAFVQFENYLMNNSMSPLAAKIQANKNQLANFRNSQIAVHFFEGLCKQEIDQLYIDFNTKGKKFKTDFY
jgi:DNA sulfur modification protein DndB